MKNILYNDKDSNYTNMVFFSIMIFMLNSFIKYFVPSVVTKILPIIAIVLALLINKRRNVYFSNNLIQYFLFGMLFFFGSLYSLVVSTGISDSISYLFSIVFVILMSSKKINWEKNVLFFAIFCAVVSTGTMIQSINPTFLYNITSYFPYTPQQRYFVIAWTRNQWYSGFFPDRAPTAFFSSMLCGCGVYYLLQKNNQKAKTIFGLIIYVYGIYGLFLSAKRGLLIGMVVSSIICYLVNRRVNGKPIIKIIISVIFLLFISYLIVINSDVAQVTISRFFVDDETDITTGRLEIYSIMLQNIEQNFLLGVGTGSVNYLAGLGGHNIYLTVLLENGIIGFILFVLSFGSEILSTIKVMTIVAKTESNDKIISLVTLSLFIQLFFLVYGMSGNPLYDNYILYYYFMGVLINENIKYRIQK